MASDIIEGWKASAW